MNRKLKICVVTHDFPTHEQPYRGAPIWRTLTRLREHAQLSVYCPVPECPALLKPLTAGRIFGHYPAAPEQVSGGLQLHALPYFAVPAVTHSRNGRSIERKLKSVLQSERPDLVLSYWIYPDSYAAVRAAEQFGIPAVVCSRGSDLKIVERSRAVRKSIRYTLAHAAAVVTVSDDLARTAERLGARSEKIITIPNGIDSSVFFWRPPTEVRSELNVGSDVRLVSFVGRLVAGKGILPLVEAMAQLHRSRPGGWKLVIVGEGPLSGSLAQRVSALGIIEHVRFTGAQPAADVAAWLNASDVFCLPSESEGCPNVIRESLSCGCPVVGTGVGGVPEMVDEHSGILLKENNPAVLAEALERACDSVWDRQDIARLQRRGWEQVAEETYSACEQVSRHQAGRLVPAGVTSADPPIVYFGNDWLAENRTSSHHLARCLAQHLPLLYVDSSTRAPRATGRDLRKIGRLLQKMFQSPRSIGEGMWHTSVPQLPFRRFPLINWLNQRLGVYLLRRCMNYLGFRHPVLWFAAPPLASMVGRLGEQFVVYYCIDDYAAHPHMDVREVSRLDEALTRSAGQLFVSSMPLLERKRPINPTAQYSPHGVDVELFGRTDDPALPVAEAAARLRHPVIGFYGLISAWIDTELITFLAKARPEWTFLMIGLVSVDLGELPHLPNVVFAGPQPYLSLPAWLKAFDVGLQPYRLNAQTIHANPLKLREYLASGKPVVSIEIPEVKRFSAYVGMAHNDEEFLRRIEEALATDNDDKRRARMEVVANMSWEARAAEAWKIAENRMRDSRTAAFPGVATTQACR